MEKLVIRGGKRLRGSVTISGAKNAVVAIIPAALLVNGVCRIENVPKIKDVDVLIEIVRNLGAKASFSGDGVLEIDSSAVSSYTADYDMVKEMRGSYYLWGALIGRFKRAKVSMPGGCDFGTRPIDQHTKGFEALGAEISMHHGIIDAKVDKLVGSHIYLDAVSVGATINIMLSACLAEGTTIIENVAKEPHVVDVANFLNAMGAVVKGAGTDVIRVIGVPEMRGGTYSTIPDQIEAGTYMIAAAAMGDDVLVQNVIPKHMDSLTAKLIEMGIDVTEYDDAIRIRNIKRPKGVTIKTLPYPGFPTDLQPQMVTLLTCAKGVSMVTETVWDNRFQYVDELKRMGANIRVEGRTAVVEGIEALSGSTVNATDLRAGAGMVIAGLMADGVTEICRLKHIDRGYENIEGKLAALGADISRIIVSGDSNG